MVNGMFLIVLREWVMESLGRGEMLHLPLLALKIEMLQKKGIAI
jgi:hypothetical protein